jgi:sulfite reductase beta subunit-like hemoprotein
MKSIASLLWLVAEWGVLATRIIPFATRWFAWDLSKAVMMEFRKITFSAQRDHGNHDVRTNARMKYLVRTLHFRALVETDCGKPFQPWREMAERKSSDWMG